MLIEDILLILFGSGISFLFVVRPIYKFIVAVIPREKDSLKEAKERLEIARKEIEAAKLNKQTEELYEKMYKETLEDEFSETEENNKNRSTR